jgi:M6 family metalloprotease-like protein
MKTSTLFLLTLILLGSLALESQAQDFMYTKAAPSGPAWSTNQNAWVDIPGLDLWFYQYARGNTCIGIAAESWSTANKRMWISAMVDGSPASPSNIVLTSDGLPMTRMFQFSATLNEGIHHVVFQVLPEDGGTANMGDRTMWVITAPNLINIVAAPSGPLLSTTNSGWEDVPGLSLNITVQTARVLTLMCNAEVLTTAGNRGWLRAVVDGVVGSPSDVVIADGSVLGSHGMTFTFPSVSAGDHVAKIQWSVDAGGTAYMGDRTLAVVESPSRTLSSIPITFKTVSAPSGLDVTTTEASFTDIPGLSFDMRVTEDATLAIVFQGEASVSGGRMAVRSVIDGNPCSPANAILSFPAAYNGTSGMTFVQKNVPGGMHHVSMQWYVDAGATGSLGDRNMTVLALTGSGVDLSDNFNDLRPVIGTVPVLTLLWDPERLTDLAPDKNAITNLLFSSQPSVADYFQENSRGNFSMGNAGILGWFKADKPASFYWSPNDPTDADGDGFISGHVRKWWEAVVKADPNVNFKSYDTNGDNILQPDELSVLIVIPQNGAFGTVRVPAAQEYPTWKPLVMDGVTIPLIAEVYAGAPPNLPTFAHELSHLMLNLPDMYFDIFFPYAAGHYSLMDVSGIDSHLDPFAKVRLGWLQPTLISKSGEKTINPVESGGEVYLLMDPAHGEKEYYLVENRQRGIKYDSDIGDNGLAVWQIMEDPAVYGSLSAPAGVPEVNWAKIPPGDWGRRAVRMIRPVYGPPFDDRKALWDGSDPLTGYDLTSTDTDPSHARLVWADGSPSGFAIRNISAAEGAMTATFEIPSTATGVQPNKALPSAFALCQNYPNPFNPTTGIRYQVPGVNEAGGEGRGSGGWVHLAIYDMLGRIVKVLVDEKKAPGSYEVRFDGSGLASGVYFYRLTAGSFAQTRKMLLLR